MTTRTLAGVAPIVAALLAHLVTPSHAQGALIMQARIGNRAIHLGFDLSDRLPVLVGTEGPCFRGRTLCHHFKCLCRARRAAPSCTPAGCDADFLAQAVCPVLCRDYQKLRRIKSPAEASAQENRGTCQLGIESIVYVKHGCRLRARDGTMWRHRLDGAHLLSGWQHLYASDHLGHGGGRRLWWLR